MNFALIGVIVSLVALGFVTFGAHGWWGLFFYGYALFMIDVLIEVFRLRSKKGGF